MGLARRCDHRATLLERIEPGDSTGGRGRVAFVPVAVLYVGLTPLGARETLAAGVVQSAATWRAETRYRADVTTRHRLEIEGTMFDIVSAQPRGRRDALDLELTEVRS